MNNQVETNINNFDVFLDYGITINDSSLYELYMPIIGYKAIFIYKYFVEQIRLKKFTSLSINVHNDLFNNLDISSSEFEIERKKLESIGLIKTFLETSSGLNKLIYYLQKPLDYNDFFANKKYVDLLRQCLTKYKFDELVYKFNNFVLKGNFNEISENIDWLYNHNNVKLETEFDFVSFYQKLLQYFHMNVIIDEISKAKISYYYQNFSLDNNDIFIAITNSVILDKANNQYLIEYNSLIFNIEKILNLNNFTNPKTVSKINRNFAIFNYKANLEQFKVIINDYSEYNSENYLINLTKSDLDFNMRKTISKMRNCLNLADPIINCIIDYSIFHNNGKLIPNYIYKIGQSINNLGINSINKIIEYLQCVSNNIKPTISYICTSKETNETIKNCYLNQELLVDQIDYSDPWGEDEKF